MSICDSIKKKYIRLSKGQRKVAQFVLDYPYVIASQVASEVGRQAGVSESTVIRFCYAMDLSGFSELQQRVKDYLIEKDGAAPTSVSRLKKTNTPAHVIMSQDIELVENTMQNIEASTFEQAIEYLHKAQQIFVLGLRSAEPAAFWMAKNLKAYREKIYLMTIDEKKMALDLAQMDERTVLFIVGVNEQQEDVMAVVEIARRKGVKVIAITDGVPCPLQEKSDVLFTIGAPAKSFHSYDVAVISLLHALVESMVKQYKAYYTGIKTISSQHLEVESFRLT